MNEYLNKLTKFTTSDIADGLLNLHKDGTGGFLPNLTRRSGKGTTCGIAYTVLFVPIDDPRPTINYIDVIPADSMLVLALPVSMQKAYAPFVTTTQAMYGGLMSTRAQYQGCKGTVVFGRIRDVEEHKNLNYSVYSYGVGACAPKAAVKPVLTNTPLQILTSDGEVRVINPGDIVVADDQGITCIQYKTMNMNKFIRYIEKSVEVDEKVCEDIKSGIPAKEAQKKRREVLKEYL